MILFYRIVSFLMLLHKNKHCEINLQKANKKKQRRIFAHFAVQKYDSSSPFFCTVFFLSFWLGLLLEVGYKKCKYFSVVTHSTKKRKKNERKKNENEK